MTCSSHGEGFATVVVRFESRNRYDRIEHPDGWVWNVGDEVEIPECTYDNLVTDKTITLVEVARRCRATRPKHGEELGEELTPEPKSRGKRGTAAEVVEEAPLSG